VNHKLPAKKGFTTFSLYECGFTLIELLIVITITAMFASFGVINFRSNKQEHDVRKELLKISSFMETAQINASSSVACGNLGSGAYWIIRMSPQNGKIKLLCQKDLETKEIKEMDIDRSAVASSVLCISGSEAIVDLSGNIHITYAPLTGVGVVSGISGCGEGFILRLKSLSDEKAYKDLTVYSQGLTNVQK
jgi:prepilin-type N-terminal cleavage/methylation domain-containing protein